MVKLIQVMTIYWESFQLPKEHWHLGEFKKRISCILLLTHGLQLTSADNYWS